ncbi:GrpB family protein [Thalassomonas actiniarum]|uniref:GrpB family protein n=1 Tax=Thalassomonas actiniarum TaxID=485447 RepID=A0AAE9YT35_9GAMM|nr:GrpB family protein [Thalassomonas actiniarum]WDD99973.1 GrpB family protein [Thalassomonas actiniarum]
MKRRVLEVVDYDPAWGKLFADEQILLVKALGDVALNIHHIGSTSVTGLAAKPVIDILMEVSDLEAVESKNQQMLSLGYEVKGENGIAGRRYFQKGGNARSHHLHAFKTGDEALTRHLAFRDYLVAHPQIAQQYGELKQGLILAGHNSSAPYMQGKNDFIQHHEKLALSWYLSR